MADITMCADSKDCPKRNICYRSTAVASVFQSYMNFYEFCMKNNYSNLLSRR